MDYDLHVLALIECDFFDINSKTVSKKFDKELLKMASTYQDMYCGSHSNGHYMGVPGWSLL